MSLQNKKTLCSGHGPAEVWVTHKLISDRQCHLESVSGKPWDEEYLQAAPPITTYASNERYVRGDIADEWERRNKRLEVEAAKLTEKVKQAEAKRDQLQEVLASIACNVDDVSVCQHHKFVEKTIDTLRSLTVYAKPNDLVTTSVGVVAELFRRMDKELF